MTRGEKAEAYFKSGYNCAQSVVLAYADMLGIDEDTLVKLSSSFGGGIGRLREVCGAVSGMAIIAGVLKGYSDPSDKNAKAEHYALVQELAGAFKEENGTIICRELLSGVKNTNNSQNPTPAERNATYYAVRPCAELVKCAADILEAKFIK